MSSPEWSRYMHEELGLPEPPEEINDEVVRRMEARYRERAAAAAGRDPGGGAPRGPLAARARVVVEPPADRAGARPRRSGRAVPGDGVVGGGRARQAVPGRLPRGGAPPRRRAGARGGGRGLPQRDPVGEGCGPASGRDPEPVLPPARRGARRRRRGAPRDRRADPGHDRPGRPERRAGRAPPARARQSTRPSRTQPLWPPRPIAFESATSISASRASFGT